QNYNAIRATEACAIWAFVAQTTDLATEPRRHRERLVSGFPWLASDLATGRRRGKEMLQLSRRQWELSPESNCNPSQHRPSRRSEAERGRFEARGRGPD